MSHPLRERYQGALVGVLAGDSLGAPYEKWKPEDIAADLIRRGGLVPFDYTDPWGRSGHFPAGRPTDDSELTAALAVSLIECRGSVPSHQYALFKRAVEGESFVWEGKADGFGGTTQKMLTAPTYEEAREQEDRPYVASNGSLMRSAPLALYYHRQRRPSMLEEEARTSSRVTHLHTTAVECCVVYVRMLYLILNGEELDRAWDIVVNCRSSDLEVATFLERKLEKPSATNVWMGKGGLAGSALHTLHIAIWSTLHATDFRDGIEKAIRFGGDTDTAAAVAGGLLGARFGVNGVPYEWREILKGHDRMRELADRLYENK